MFSVMVSTKPVVFEFLSTSKLILISARGTGVGAVVGGDVGSAVGTDVGVDEGVAVGRVVGDPEGTFDKETKWVIHYLPP